MAYRIALFDIDNTLLDFTRSEHEALYACLVARGLPADEETLALYSRINDRHWKQLELGLTTRERLKVGRFSDLFDALGYHGDPATMAEDYRLDLATRSYLVDGALELIRALHGKCRLYGITNGTASVQKGRFDHCPLSPFFERCFISEEMDCAKPEKIFFDRVAEGIPHFSPSDALVIGDSLSSDIRGGVNAGLDTCWFNPGRASAPADLPITYTVHTLAEIVPILIS